MSRSVLTPSSTIEFSCRGAQQRLVLQERYVGFYVDGKQFDWTNSWPNSRLTGVRYRKLLGSACFDPDACTVLKLPVGYNVRLAVSLQCDTQTNDITQQNDAEQSCVCVSRGNITAMKDYDRRLQGKKIVLLLITKTTSSEIHKDLKGLKASNPI